MHNHNKGGGDHGMMWMMIPCLLLIGVLFLNGGKWSGEGYFWPIIFGVFVVAHVWMMFKGHGNHSGTSSEDKADGPSTKNETSKEHTQDGNCH